MKLDDIIVSKGIVEGYMGELLDYIAAKTASGEAIRFMKMDDAYKIIKKIM